jgi:hypothetical protein
MFNDAVRNTKKGNKVVVAQVKLDTTPTFYFMGAKTLYKSRTVNLLPVFKKN